MDSAVAAGQFRLSAAGGRDLLLRHLEAAHVLIRGERLQMLSPAHAVIADRKTLRGKILHDLRVLIRGNAGDKERGRYVSVLQNLGDCLHCRSIRVALENQADNLAVCLNAGQKLRGLRRNRRLGRWRYGRRLRLRLRRRRGLGLFAAGHGQQQRQDEQQNYNSLQGHHHFSTALSGSCKSPSASIPRSVRRD